VAAIEKLLNVRGESADKTAEGKTRYLTEGLKAIQEHVSQRRCRERGYIESEVNGK